MPKGFEPVYDKNSRILILGSFPSVKSREVNFYYGNKQNRFWKILSEIFNYNIGDSISEKIDFLLKNKIAIWDIAQECEIKGSSDNTIKQIKVADLSIILKNSDIKKIICNGKKAYEIFLKYYSHLNIENICLPSTSPANVSFNKELWKNELTKGLNYGI
jgi:hypoxanthine-DNA glycosylase